MPTARLGEEMPGSNALHTDLHTLVRTTTDAEAPTVISTRTDTRNHQPNPH
jgi:hypothetical protein